MEKSSPTFGGVGVGTGLRISGAFKNAIFDRTTICLLLWRTVVFVQGSGAFDDLPIAAVVAAAALLGTLVFSLSSAVWLCVFGSCRLYSHCEVLPCTLNKFHLNLYLFPFVPLITWTLDSVRNLCVWGHDLQQSSAIVFRPVFVLLGMVCVTGYAQCWRT